MSIDREDPEHKPLPVNLHAMPDVLKITANITEQTPPPPPTPPTLTGPKRGAPTTTPPTTRGGGKA